MSLPSTALADGNYASSRQWQCVDYYFPDYDSHFCAWATYFFDWNIDGPFYDLAQNKFWIIRWMGAEELLANASPQLDDVLNHPKGSFEVHRGDGALVKSRTYMTEGLGCQSYAHADQDWFGKACYTPDIKVYSDTRPYVKIWWWATGSNVISNFSYSKSRLDLN